MSIHSHTTSVGIDLSGYSSAETAVVVATHVGETIFLEILRDHPLDQRRRGDQSLEQVILTESTFLQKLARLGSIVVDAPIDLQNLDRVFSGEILRQSIKGLCISDLFKRPIDRFFGALSPVADRLAAVVVRLNAIRAHLRAQEVPAPTLGESLFETYPRASLEILLAARPTGYKGGEHFVFHGTVPSRHRPIESVETLLERLSYVYGVSIHADQPTVIDDNVVDAAICAITGLGVAGPYLARDADDLQRFGLEYARPIPADLVFPQGYRILAAMPKGITRLVFR